MSAPTRYWLHSSGSGYGLVLTKNIAERVAISAITFAVSTFSILKRSRYDCHCHPADTRPPEALTALAYPLTTRCTKLVCSYLARCCSAARHRGPAFYTNASDKRLHSYAYGHPDRTPMFQRNCVNQSSSGLAMLRSSLTITARLSSRACAPIVPDGSALLRLIPCDRTIITISSAP